MSANDTISGNTTSGPTNDAPGLDAATLAALSTHILCKQVSLALVAWVVYDYFLTMADSVTLFWSYRWSISKVLFLLSRYVTLVTVIINARRLSQILPTCCRISPWLRVIGATILITLMNLVLVARIYALWNRSRLILCVTMFGLVVNTAYYFGTVTYTNATSDLGHTALPFTGCSLVSHYTKAWTLLLVALGYEAFLVVLTAIKSYPIVVQRGFNTPLYSLLLRDGFVYFFIIMIMQIISTVAIFRPTPLTIVLLVTFPTLSIIGISCSRLLLRLQRTLVGVGEEPYSEFAITNLTNDWPIVTFGGSGGKQRANSGQQTTTTLEYSHTSKSIHRPSRFPKSAPTTFSHGSLAFGPSSQSGEHGGSVLGEEEEEDVQKMGIPLTGVSSSSSVYK